MCCWGSTRDLRLVLDRDLDDPADRDHAGSIAVDAVDGDEGLGEVTLLGGLVDGPDLVDEGLGSLVAQADLPDPSGVVVVDVGRSDLLVCHFYPSRRSCVYRSIQPHHYITYLQKSQYTVHL